MLTYKKTTIRAFALVLVTFFSVLLLNTTKPSSAFAQSVSVAMPKVEGISNSKLTQYKDSLFYVDEYAYGNGYKLNYRYYMPEETTGKIPLVIFLHGRGERGSDNDSQLNNAIMRPFITNENSMFYNAMVIAPQCPVKEYNNGWVELFSDDESANSLAYDNYSVDDVAESTECKAIVSLIEDVCSKKNVDRNRVYLIGLSQGAVATWDLLARHSDLFAAAVPIAGVGDVSKAQVYADIPIYAFHGDADRTVPYEKATPRMYEAINAVGKNKMNFVTFTGGAHSIWEAVMVFDGTDELPALEDWLFSQVKKTGGDTSSSAATSSTTSAKKGGGCFGAIGTGGLALGMIAIIGAAVVVRKKDEI